MNRKERMEINKAWESCDIDQKEFESFYRLLAYFSENPVLKKQVQKVRENLFRIRERLEVSTEELTSKIVSTSTLRNFERGLRCMRLENLLQVVSRLEIPFQAIFSDVYVMDDDRRCYPDWSLFTKAELPLVEKIRAYHKMPISIDKHEVEHFLRRQGEYEWSQISFITKTIATFHGIPLKNFNNTTSRYRNFNTKSIIKLTRNLQVPMAMVFLPFGEVINDTFVFEDLNVSSVSPTIYGNDDAIDLAEAEFQPQTRRPRPVPSEIPEELISPETEKNILQTLVNLRREQKEEDKKVFLSKVIADYLTEFPNG